MIRFHSRVVMVGDLPMGGGHPVRIQSMTSTPTLDTGATVRQILRLKEAGSEYVRLTARSIREAEHLAVISKELRKLNADLPLIADVHFNPRIAEKAARIAAKVRINPGNYLPEIKEMGNPGMDPARITDHIYRHIRPLLTICRENGTALRVGSNHGSLSPRIMSLYGDTPLGMVESALEFARVCRMEGFNDVVISMKSSNTRVMVQANRLLVRKMIQEGMDYPIHLGVTEAGEGEDGRIKSAIGIGSLLCKGIGDTIRVSLTEDPELEIPVARRIIEAAGGGRREAGGGGWSADSSWRSAGMGSEEYRRRETVQVGNAGGKMVPLVAGVDPLPEERIRIHPDDLTEGQIRQLNDNPRQIVIAEAEGDDARDLFRKMFRQLEEHPCSLPVILKIRYPRMDPETLVIRASVDLGPLLVDGLGDGIWIEAPGQDPQFICDLSFGILQGCRCRFTKTEFIACPSCGRTLFNIQETLRTIRERMGHLKNVKIAVMGCIVNGPGEMADADYGYVGSGPGKITLYKGKKVIKNNIDAGNALQELEKIIRDNGDWIDL